MGAAIRAIPPTIDDLLARHGLTCTGLTPGRCSAQPAAARSSPAPGRSGNAALVVRFRAAGNSTLRPRVRILPDGGEQT
jgi:hypothetical protein